MRQGSGTSSRRFLDLLENSGSFGLDQGGLVITDRHEGLLANVRVLRLVLLRNRILSGVQLSLQFGAEVAFLHPTLPLTDFVDDTDIAHGLVLLPGWA